MNVKLLLRLKNRFNSIYLQAVQNRAFVYLHRAVEVAFFVTGLETLQILGVEMTTGDSTESNVRSFESIESSIHNN
jgi:hypothetical protein